MKSLWVPIASFVAGALLMLAGLWVVVGYPDVEHVSVRIYEARLLDAETHRVELLVGSCNGAPRATSLRGPEYLEVEVTAFRFKHDQDDCQDVLEVSFSQSDLGPLPAELLDTHAGEVVEISGGR